MCGGDGYTAFFLTRDVIGDGDRLLGEKLMGAWCHHLSQGEGVPSVLCFMNAGIRLCLEGHACVEFLRQLEQAFPVLSFSREYNIVPTGQIKTRVQAFLEKIEIARAQRKAVGGEQ